MIQLMRLDRFTEPAKEALVLAENEAVTSHHVAIDTCDLLLGLLQVRYCVAARALEPLNVTDESVRLTISEINKGPEAGPSSTGISQRLTFTRAVRGVISLALSDEVFNTNHADKNQKHTDRGDPFLCTGEVILPMLKVPHGVKIGVDAPGPVEVLTRLGVDPRIAYDAVLDLARRTPADEPVE